MICLFPFAGSGFKPQTRSPARANCDDARKEGSRPVTSPVDYSSFYSDTEGGFSQEEEEEEEEYAIPELKGMKELKPSDFFAGYSLLSEGEIPVRMYPLSYLCYLCRCVLFCVSPKESREELDWYALVCRT